MLPRLLKPAGAVEVHLWTTFVAGVDFIIILLVYYWSGLHSYTACVRKVCDIPAAAAEVDFVCCRKAATFQPELCRCHNAWVQVCLDVVRKLRHAFVTYL